jgi:hypothetical protein
MGMTAKKLNAVPVMRYDLKDCPWCGSSPHMEYWHGGGPNKRRIGCDNPDCDVNPSVTAESAREAETKWERRR